MKFTAGKCNAIHFKGIFVMTLIWFWFNYNYYGKTGIPLRTAW